MGLKTVRILVILGSWVFSGALLLACYDYFFSISGSPLFGALSIAVPWLMLANLLWILLWVLWKKKLPVLPPLALLLGFLSFGTIYEPGSNKIMVSESGIRVMTFNTRSFRDGRYVTDYDRENKIANFVETEAPDLVCFQEFNRWKAKEFAAYPYQWITPTGSSKSTQAIFSKYPILNTGSVEFPESRNNCLFADILYKEDTLRIYNAHLQSYNIGSRRFLLRNFGADFIKRLGSVAKKHREQARLVKEHQEAAPYPSLICGDFNATAFSHTYRILGRGMQDTFREKGAGWGTTFYLSGRLPFRIDYILADPHFEVLSHRNYGVRFSDHLPVMATLRPRGEVKAVR